MACNVTSENYKTSRTNSFLRVTGAEGGEKRVGVIAWQVNFFYIFSLFFGFIFIFPQILQSTKQLSIIILWFSSCSCFLLSLHTISISIFLFINGR